MRLKRRLLLGRYLTPQDDQPSGGTPSGFGVVISEGFLAVVVQPRARCSSDGELTIANAPFTVVGVMPQQLHRRRPDKVGPQIYAPIWAEPVIDAPYDNIARRSPGRGGCGSLRAATPA